MKMKFGAIVVDGSGKIGGHVASKNKAGNYLRTKVTPTNPNTVAQQNARALLSSLATAWGELTDAQRLAWNGAVADYATTNIFGDIKNPSGFNLFVKLNANLSNASLTAVSVPPAKMEIPYDQIDTVIGDVSVSELTIAFAGNEYAGISLLVSATPAVSAGKTNVNTLYRNIGVFTPVTNTIEVWDAYVEKFGTPAIDANISIKIEPVVASGQKGTAQTSKASIVA